MFPLTSFLSCTAPIDELECFSTRQKHHGKTYVTGLVAASNKTVDGISTHVLSAKSERALNNFLTEYDWDEDRLNKERLELLQKADDTRWSSEGVVIINDTFTHKTDENIPSVGNPTTIPSQATDGDKTSYTHSTPMRKSPIRSASAYTKKTPSDVSNSPLPLLTNSSR